jgi:DNA-binding CsgD family transcriptional regulator
MGRAMTDARVARATSEARVALGLAEGEGGRSDAVSVAHLIRLVEARLSELSADSGWRDASAAQAEQLARLHRRYEARFSALADVRGAVAELREVTSPGTILDRAPEQLCLNSQLERAVLSLVRDGVLIAQAAHFRGDPAGAAVALEALRADPPRLEHPLIEADLLRRRRATIVADAQVHPRVHRPMAEAMGWPSYIAAPLVVRGEVIGAMHADTAPSGRTLDVLDGDVLWTFGAGLAQVYEAASLRRSLRDQRSDMRQFVEWVGVRWSELNDASMTLAADESPPPEPPGVLDVAPVSHAEDLVVFDEVLTRRELDVLRLLARGETNDGIAAHLVISPATVKFHVVNLLRKLHVRNRAEAASRYHRLVQARAGGGD